MVKVTTYTDEGLGEEVFPEASGVNLTPNGDLLVVAPAPNQAQGGRIMQCFSVGSWQRAIAEESRIAQAIGGDMPARRKMPGKPIGSG